VVPVAPSLSSITDPFTGTDLNGGSIQFERCFDLLGIDLDRVRGEFKKACESHQFHESSAAGPNGHAVWAAHLDAYEIAADKPLYNLIKHACTSLGLNGVLERLDNLSYIFRFFDFGLIGWTGGCHSKLHVIYEKSTKARIIEIGDYFTQCVLSPFHDTIANVNKSIEADCTFDQDAGFDKVLAFTRRRDDVFSLDLSKATDRLPAVAQAAMLSALLGDDKYGDM